jgi:predicted oxidoreductase
MIKAGIHVNTADDAGIDRDGGVLDFCRIHGITIQPWSPFQYGFNQGVFLGNAKFPQLNAKIDEIAKKYGVSNTTIAMAWLLRHPAKFQPVTGTMKSERLRDCVKAADITLTRDEWYAIYLAAGNVLP